jgi:hypothetical protein
MRYLRVRVKVRDAPPRDPRMRAVDALPRVRRRAVTPSPALKGRPREVISIPNVSFIERDAMPLQPRTNLFLKRAFSLMVGFAGDLEDNSLSVGLAYGNNIIYLCCYRPTRHPGLKHLGLCCFPLRGKAHLLLTLTPIGTCRISRAASNPQGQLKRMRMALEK